MKRKIEILIFFFLASLMFSCEKNDLINLKGTWVEIDTQTDTIKFTSNNKTGTFFLHRGRELRNGHDLPKEGSGLYDYAIFSDSIKLRSGFSSSMMSNNYYFKVIELGNGFQIGVFTVFETDKAILTFEKK